MKNNGSYTCFSNGNLLITGEYFVLEGAKALAVPLKYGQEMRVDTLAEESGTLQWNLNEFSKPLFSVDFDNQKLNIIGSYIHKRVLTLQCLLRGLKTLKPGIFDGRSYKFICNVEFSLEWGWGSSSSLICNLANWSETDPFRLNRLVSSGSGYDIAASGSQTPLFYWIADEKQNIEPVKFNPPFKENILFVYTGRKQNTEDSIIKYKNSIKTNRMMIPEVSLLSELISEESNITEFIRYISDHEEILSKTLNVRRIKENYFHEFEGEIKSLGAWGGDFIMAVSPEGPDYIYRYFNRKGMHTIFTFDEIIR